MVNCRFHDYQHHRFDEKQWFDRRHREIVAVTTGQETRARPQ
jgi:hypothetical protein